MTTGLRFPTSSPSSARQRTVASVSGSDGGGCAVRRAMCCLAPTHWLLAAKSRRPAQITRPGSYSADVRRHRLFGRRPKAPTYPQRPVDRSWRRSVRVTGDIWVIPMARGPTTTHASVTTVRRWAAVRRSWTRRRFKKQSSPRGNTAACGRALGPRPKQRSHERRPPSCSATMIGLAFADVRAQVSRSDW